MWKKFASILACTISIIAVGLGFFWAVIYEMFVWRKNVVHALTDSWWNWLLFSSALLLLAYLIAWQQRTPVTLDGSNPENITIKIDKKALKNLLEKKKSKPKKKKVKKNKKPKLPDCLLGKTFGYLRTLGKHQEIPNECFNCPTAIREACLDKSKAKKLLKALRKQEENLST